MEENELTLVGPDGTETPLQIIHVDDNEFPADMQLQILSAADIAPATEDNTLSTLATDPESSILQVISSDCSMPTTRTQGAVTQGIPVQTSSTTSIHVISVQSISNSTPAITPISISTTQATPTAASTSRPMVMSYNVKAEDKNEKMQDENRPLDAAMEVDERGAPVDTLWPLIDRETKSLYCTRCSYSTDKKQNWYKHRQTHLGTRVRHRCVDCGYETGSASNMKRHQQQHTGDKPHKCSKCDASFVQKSHMLRHFQKAHVDRKHQCVVIDCGYSALTEAELKRHFARKHKDLALVGDGEEQQVSQRSFMCPHCPYLHTDRNIVQQHIKFHNKQYSNGGGGGELKMFCTQCSFVTNCSSKLRRHQLVHSDEKPFQCRLCHYKANQREHVVRHLRSKHRIIIPPHGPLKGSSAKRKPIPVAVSTNMSVEQQQQQTTGDTPENQLVEKVSGNKDPQQRLSGSSSWDKLFACNFCTLTFSKLLNLYKHVHAQHPEEMSNLSPLSCVICDFSGTSYSALLAHMRRHTASEEAKQAASAVTTLFTSSAVTTTSTSSSSSSSATAKSHLSSSILPSLLKKTEGKKTVLVNMEPNVDVPIVIDVPPPNRSEQCNINSAIKHTVEVTVSSEENTINITRKIIDSMPPNIRVKSEQQDEEEPLTLRNEDEVIMQEGEIIGTGDEMFFITGGNDDEEVILQEGEMTVTEVGEEEEEMFLGDLSTVSPEDEAQLQASIPDSTQQVMLNSDALVSGDFIQINGETYQVEVNTAFQS